jgi:hypothetical protein
MTLTQLEFSGQIFEKYSDIKFHENLSRGGRVVPCGTTDVTKSIVAARNFANAPKNQTPRKINLGICDKMHAKIRSLSSEQLFCGFLAQIPSTRQQPFPHHLL